MQVEAEEEANWKVAPNSMAFRKGQPRPQGSGRKAGTPNRMTRAAKEFVESLCDDPKVQAAVRRKVLKGEIVGFFRALDKILPDAPKTTNANVNVSATLILDHDIAED